MNVKSIIDITDAMMIAMCVPNIIALYILAPEIKKDLKNYCQRYKIGKLVNRKWIAESESAAVPVKEIIVSEEAIKEGIIKDEEKSIGEDIWQTK